MQQKLCKPTPICHDVYPAANVETTRDGIILHPSPTSVPPKAERRALDEGRGDWQR